MTTLFSENLECFIKEFCKPGFPLMTKGVLGVPITSNIGLTPLVILFGKNADFVIFMQFLTIFAKFFLHQMTPVGKLFNVVFLNTHNIADRLCQHLVELWSR